MLLQVVLNSLASFLECYVRLGYLEINLYRWKRLSPCNLCFQSMVSFDRNQYRAITRYVGVTYG